MPSSYRCCLQSLPVLFQYLSVHCRMCTYTAPLPIWNYFTAERASLDSARAAAHLAMHAAPPRLHRQQAAIPKVGAQRGVEHAHCVRHERAAAVAFHVRRAAAAALAIARTSRDPGSKKRGVSRKKSCAATGCPVYAGPTCR